jgi:hypothetical protein
VIQEKNNPLSLIGIQLKMRAASWAVGRPLQRKKRTALWQESRSPS